LRADVSEEQVRRNANSTGFASDRGRKTPSVMAPAARTAPTNSRAAIGRSFTRLRLRDAGRVAIIPPRRSG
jgi:hypothetical protein